MGERGRGAGLTPTPNCHEPTPTLPPNNVKVDYWPLGGNGRITAVYVYDPKSGTIQTPTPGVTP